jgi:hypothetical protein
MGEGNTTVEAPSFRAGRMSTCQLSAGTESVSIRHDNIEENEIRLFGFRFA